MHQAEQPMRELSLTDCPCRQFNELKQPKDHLMRLEPAMPDTLGKKPTQTIHRQHQATDWQFGESALLSVSLASLFLI